MDSVPVLDAVGRIVCLPTQNILPFTQSVLKLVACMTTELPLPL
jgi:hypothetical protein